MLWVLTASWLAACGRLGFDANDDGLGNGVPDAGPTVDAAPDAPPDAPVGPLAKITVPTGLTTLCGGTGSTDKFTITNDGDQPLVLGEVNLDEAGGFQLVDAFSGATVQKGETLTFSLQVPDAVVGNDIAGDVRTGTIRFASNMVNGLGEAKDVEVNVSALVTGANLVVKSPAGNLNLLFSSNSPACPANRNVTVTNNGNRSIDIDAPFLSASGFELSSNASGRTLAKGQTATIIFHAGTSTDCSGTGQVIFGAASGAMGLCTVSSGLEMTVSFNIAGGSSGCSCS